MCDLTTPTTRILDPTKWSFMLGGGGNLPADIIKFHLHLVLLDYSQEEITAMLDGLQSDHDSWTSYSESMREFDRRAGTQLAHEFEFDWIEDPREKERTMWKREARDIFVRLSNLDKSEWGFARALRAHYSPLRRHRPQPGDFGYGVTRPDSAPESELHCMESDSGCLEFDPNYVDISTAKEWQDALALLRRKLEYACKSEAARIDVPVEVMLYCAVVNELDVEACLRLASFFQTWRSTGYPYFADDDEVESFLAYWIKTRWDTLEPAHGGAVPQCVQDDILTIRAFCGWRGMPKISGFAQALSRYAGDPLDERMYRDPRALHIYLAYTQRWFVEDVLNYEEDDDDGIDF